MSINKVFLSGNITNDPSMRSTPAGMQILEFGLAVNERRKNSQTGQWDEVPNYFDARVFGNRAEALSRFLTKGTKVSIEGHLRWSSWQDKNTGQKRSKIEVIVDELELMSARQQQGQPQGQQYAPRQAPPQMAPTAPQMPQYAPQQPQGYPSAMPQQMAPQMAPQQPVAAVPQPQMDIYDEDIPFS